MTIEKRIIFSIEELQDTAKAYEHFLSWIETSPSAKTEKKFIGERIDLTHVPKSFDYDRVEELELWCIRKITNTNIT